MTVSPLVGIARQQAAEAATEVCVPLAVATGAWVLARSVLADAVPGVPLTPMELDALLGACVALTGWATSRQLYLYGRRGAWASVFGSVGVSAMLLLGLPAVVRHDFAAACDEAGGVLVDTTPVEAGPDDGVEAGGSPSRRGRSVASQGRRVCRVGPATENVYLPGVLLRPAWDGVVSPFRFAGLGLLAGVSALGLRTRRLRPTTIPHRVADALRLAPAAGSASVPGDPAPKNGRVQACGNATLWGEVCGQLYAAEKVFAPGEWCRRCNQVYRPVDRELTFQVVSLFSGDVDVLNGLERVDTVSWRQGEAMPPDARLSGQERWVRLGTVRLPDVITVAQALALVHEQLGTWAGSPAVQGAAELAIARASRIHCWVWQGPVANRLTYARPTADATLAIGPVRLRDLDLDTGAELTLQLDIGLLPLELWVGFRKTFLDAGRGAEVQNSRQTLWIPVGPPGPIASAPGVWVPRVEGDALRAWLSTEQARSDEQRGVTTPRPYAPAGSGGGGGQVGDVPPQGPLDLVRTPVERDEPVLGPRVGASIAEWKWLEAGQVALLRREALVLVDSAANTGRA